MSWAPEVPASLNWLQREPGLACSCIDISATGTGLVGVIPTIPQVHLLQTPPPAPAPPCVPIKGSSNTNSDNVVSFGDHPSIEDGLLGLCQLSFPGAARLNHRALEISNFKFLLYQLKIFDM